MSGITVSDTVPNAQAYQAILPGANSTVAIGASSTQSIVFDVHTSIIRIMATVDCFIQFGASPTATTSSMILPAGVIEYFGVTEDQGMQLAVIQSKAAGTLYITEGA